MTDKQIKELAVELRSTIHALVIDKDKDYYSYHSILSSLREIEAAMFTHLKSELPKLVEAEIEQRGKEGSRRANAIGKRLGLNIEPGVIGAKQ